MKNLTKILLIVIIVIGSFLRLYKLDQVPNGLNQDEAVLAYDAYSLATNLKDHHGNFLPPMLESFEDWASPTMSFVTAPFVKILGLNEFSARFPNALLGIFSIILIFLIVRNLTSSNIAAAFSSFIFATSPFAVNTARWTLPPNGIAFFLLVLIFVFFNYDNFSNLFSKLAAKFKHEGIKYLVIFSKFLFLATAGAALVYCYPTQKVFGLIIFVVASLLFLKNKKQFFVTSFLFFALISPIFYLTFRFPAVYNARFDQVSLLSRSDHLTADFLQRYTTYLNLDFWFGTGDTNLMHHIPNFSQIDSVFAVFIIIGAILLLIFTIDKFIKLKNKSELRFAVKNNKYLFLLVSLFVAPIPASLTIDLSHSLRIIHLLPILCILAGVGIIFLYEGLKEKFSNHVIFITFLLIFLVCFYNLYNFSQFYFEKYPQISAGNFQYGIKEAYTNVITQNPSKVIVQGINQPYIYFLFYSQFDPNNIDYNELKNFADKAQGGFIGVEKFANWEFRNVTANEVQNSKLEYQVTKFGITWFEIRKSNIEDTFYIIQK